MKKILILLTMVFLFGSVTVNAQTTKDVNNRLYSNWMNYKTNVPSIVFIQKQIDTKETEMDAIKAREKLRRAEAYAKGLAAPKDAEGDKYFSLLKESGKLKAQIELERLKYFDKNKKTVEDYLKSQKK